MSWDKAIELAQKKELRPSIKALIELSYTDFQNATDLNSLSQAYDRLIKNLAGFEDAAKLQKDPLPSLTYAFIDPLLQAAETSGQLVLTKAQELMLVTALDAVEENRVPISLDKKTEAKLRNIGINTDQPCREIILEFISFVTERSRATSAFQAGLSLVRARDYEASREHFLKTIPALMNEDPFNPRYQRFKNLLALERDNWRLPAKAALALDKGSMLEAEILFERATFSAGADLQRKQVEENQILNNSPQAVKNLFYETRARYILQTALELEKRGDIPNAVDRLQKAKLLFDQIKDPVYKASLLAEVPEFSETEYQTKYQELDTKLAQGMYTENLTGQIKILEERLKESGQTIESLQEKIRELEAENKELRRGKRSIFSFRR